MSGSEGWKLWRISLTFHLSHLPSRADDCHVSLTLPHAPSPSLLPPSCTAEAPGPRHCPSSHLTQSCSSLPSAIRTRPRVAGGPYSRTRVSSKSHPEGHLVSPVPLYRTNSRGTYPRAMPSAFKRQGIFLRHGGSSPPSTGQPAPGWLQTTVSPMENLPAYVFVLSSQAGPGG